MGTHRGEMLRRSAGTDMHARCPSTMRLLRAVGLFDVAIIILIAIGVLMPAREMYASPAIKGEAQQFAVALAEARTLAHADDGLAVEELARKLGDVGLKD